MESLKNVTTSRGEVKTPTKEQFERLLATYKNNYMKDINENIKWSEDGKKMTFDMPQQIKLTLIRKGSIRAFYNREYGSPDNSTIEDYHASRDYDSPFTLEFEWGQEKIKLTGGTAYDLLHRFAKALAAITEYETEQ